MRRNLNKTALSNCPDARQIKRWRFDLCGAWRQKFEAAGDTREWKTIRRLLSTHSLVSTWLPLSDGQTVPIRKASVPDAEQAQVYKILGVDWKKAHPTVKSVFNPYPIL